MSEKKLTVFPTIFAQNSWHKNERDELWQRQAAATFSGMWSPKGARALPHPILDILGVKAYACPQFLSNQGSIIKRRCPLNFKNVTISPIWQRV